LIASVFIIAVEIKNNFKHFLIDKMYGYKTAFHLYPTFTNYLTSPLN
jgi:hypothetical protein